LSGFIFDINKVEPLDGTQHEKKIGKLCELTCVLAYRQVRAWLFNWRKSLATKPQTVIICLKGLRYHPTFHLLWGCCPDIT